MYNKLSPLDLASELSLSLYNHCVRARAKAYGSPSCPCSCGGGGSPRGHFPHFHGRDLRPLPRDLLPETAGKTREYLIISMPVVPSGNQWSSRDRKRLNQKRDFGPIPCPPYIRSLATSSSVEDTTSPWVPPPTVGMPRPFAIGREAVYQP